jgi:hypothetical protein
MGDCVAHTNSKKAVYRALFLTWDYNAKSQKSKQLPRESKIYKAGSERQPLVPHKHISILSISTSAAIITNKK